jgi:hypothetical protein
MRMLPKNIKQISQNKIEKKTKAGKCKAIAISFLVEE